MEKYKIGKILGDGTFGQVMLAQNLQTGQIVAIKKMKKMMPKWEDCLKLPEIKSL
jgi:serine/threonine protein kinase